MSLATLKGKVASAFNKIGTTNGTAPPTSQENRASIAYEYFVADLLASLANKRKDVAKAEATNAGLLNAPEIGLSQTSYENEHLQIIGKTNAPASRIDATILSNELTKKYGSAEAQRIVKLATVANKPATSYTFVGKMEDA